MSVGVLLFSAESRARGDVRRGSTGSFGLVSAVRRFFRPTTGDVGSMPALVEASDREIATAASLWHVDGADLNRRDALALIYGGHVR